MITDDQIREVFLANGFTIKDGQTDLKPYVYAAARALLAMAPGIPLSKCRGITDSRCPYLGHCGVGCNKCGRVHDGQNWMPKEWRDD